MPRKAVAAETRRQQVLDKMLQGQSIQKVAEDLHISERTVYRDFKTALADHKLDDRKIGEWRVIMSLRFDRILAKLTDKFDAATEAKEVAELARAIVRIEERRAKIFGIDKPQEIDVRHHLPALDPEEAAKRQRQRLNGAGFQQLTTSPPKNYLPKDDEKIVDVKEA